MKIERLRMVDMLDEVTEHVREDFSATHVFRERGVVMGHKLIDMAPREGATDLDDFGRMIRVNDADVLRVRGPRPSPSGELQVPTAAVWTYPSGGPRSMAYVGSHLNPDTHVALVPPQVARTRPEPCDHCGLRRSVYDDEAAHRASRTCRTAPLRRELADLDYIHVDNDAQAARLRALGVDVRTADTSLIGAMDSEGGSGQPRFDLETWAPRWAVTLDRRDTAVHNSVAEWATTHAVQNEEFRAALIAIFRLGGLRAFVDFVNMQPGALAAWEGRRA